MTTDTIPRHRREVDSLPALLELDRMHRDHDVSVARSGPLQHVHTAHVRVSEHDGQVVLVASPTAAAVLSQILTRFSNMYSGTGLVGLEDYDPALWQRVAIDIQRHKALAGSRRGAGPRPAPRQRPPRLCCPGAAVSAPRNTSDDPDLVFLAASMGQGGVSQAILEQESAGQAQILASTVLPTEGSGNPELLELGFTFGAKVPGDPLFREATLPAGWSRKGTDHSMHTNIVDERGIERVNVFYKAAFYDRRADMHIINVGYALATHWIYGDETDLVLRDDLTDSELANAHEHASYYLDQAVESPSIYGDRKPRAIELYQASKAEIERRKNARPATRRRGRRR